MNAKLEVILNEFRTEMPATRRVLERFPGDKLAWKPHAKSRSLVEPASHIAGIAGMAKTIATTDEFVPGSASPLQLKTVEEIGERFEQNVQRLRIGSE